MCQLCSVEIFDAMVEGLVFSLKGWEFSAQGKGQRPAALGEADEKASSPSG